VISGGGQRKKKRKKKEKKEKKRKRGKPNLVLLRLMDSDIASEGVAEEVSLPEDLDAHEEADGGEDEVVNDPVELELRLPRGSLHHRHAAVHQHEVSQGDQHHVERVHERHLDVVVVLEAVFLGEIVHKGGELRVDRDDLVHHHGLEGIKGGTNWGGHDGVLQHLAVGNQ